MIRETLVKIASSYLDTWEMDEERKDIKVSDLASVLNRCYTGPRPVTSPERFNHLCQEVAKEALIDRYDPIRKYQKMAELAGDDPEKWEQIGKAALAEAQALKDYMATRAKRD